MQICASYWREKRRPVQTALLGAQQRGNIAPEDSKLNDARIGYFVHDVHDATAAKRVRALLAGGADVVVFGFRRTDEPLNKLAGAPVIDLGRTFDARLAQRAGAVLTSTIRLRRWRTQLSDRTILLARSLESLLIASAARAHAPGARLIYECLDLHRLVMGDGPRSVFLRAVERSMLAQSTLTIVSSPAYRDQYFRTRQSYNGDVLLLENKLLDLSSHAPAPWPPKRVSKVWQIGWFGMVRCQKSLDALDALTRRAAGKIEIVTRGRPAYDQFRDFHAQIAASPFMTFGGPYRAEEIGALYQNVDFAWCVDFFEEGLNSAIHLPNRIYEGSRWGVIPIALANTEIAVWLRARGVGIVIENVGEALYDAMVTMTPEAFVCHQAAVRKIPPSDLVHKKEDCQRLVDCLLGRYALAEI